MTPLLHLHRVYKTIDKTPLLDIKDWRIDEASATVLTGVNGSGKSTLLRILCGLESADIGELSLQGKPLRLQPYPDALRTQLVYVHQHPVMFAASVWDNIAYGLRQRKLAAGEIATRVTQVMAWAGITHLSRRTPEGLSGGEKQRIALARARVLEPRLLLLDEPTSNLDGAAREQVIGLITAIKAEGNSIIIVCHDRDLISLPGMQRVKLKDGRLQTR